MVGALHVKSDLQNFTYEASRIKFLYETFENTACSVSFVVR